MRGNAAGFAWRREWFSISLLLVVCMASLHVFADVVVLKNGSRFEGKVLKDTPQKVVLEMQYGTMDFPREQIKEIVKRAAPLQTEQPKPKPGEGPGVKETPSEETRAAAGETRGKITVAQKLESTTKIYLMDIKDAVAIFHDDGANKMIEVSFLPFKLSDEDIRKLRGARGDGVLALVGSKPTPDKRYWENRCPYASAKIKFEQGKEPELSTIRECEVCFYGFTHANENASDTWKGAKARRAIPKFSLTMNKNEGTLEISFIGRFSFKREISWPAQDHSYSWNIDARCKVFVK
ncbi:MAG: hypothetical protein GXP25_10055 [Planctomycetes bacterium]|nr:hypothetical protein [Planctomycetota bacterium]